MNDRKHPLLLAALPIAWLLLGTPVSAYDEHGAFHDDPNAALGDGHDQLSAGHDDGHNLIYVEHGEGREISRELAADQRTRYEEEKQGDLDRERQDSRERSDGSSRYYWWWPFTR